MAIEVIGAGFGRTGTHSLKLALEKLGFAQCYHMEELVMKHPERVNFWNALSTGESVDFEAYFEGYRAAVDFPAFRYYKQLMQHYPAAKVILTIRDPDSWYRSFGDTIIRNAKPSMFRIIGMAIRMPFNKTLRKRLQVFRFVGARLKEFFQQGFENKAEAIRIFNDWIADVQQTVPPEKLLVLNIQEGWVPLCAFLDVPVPDEPFPHSNTTADFQNREQTAL